MFRFPFIPRAKTKELPSPCRNIEVSVRNDHRVDHSADPVEPVIEFQRPASHVNHATDARRTFAMTYLVLVQLAVDDVVKGQLAATNGAGGFGIERRIPATGQSPRSRQFELDQLARLAIQAGGIGRRTRHDEFFPIDDQVTLRCQAANGLGVVWLLPKQIAQSFVAPDQGTGGGVQSADEHTFERPDSGREVDPAIRHHRPTANRPYRNQPAVTQEPAIAGHHLVLPTQAARCQIYTIEIPVVRTEAHRFASDRRSEANGSIRLINPELEPRDSIVCGDRIVKRRSDQQVPLGDDRFIPGIKLQSRAAIGWHGQG